MRKYLLIALFAVLLTPSANAQFVTGNKLLEWLNQEDKVYSLMAMGYITGVADALSNELCVPPRVTIKQLTDIVHNALRKMPAQRHLAADVIVYAALQAAYKCGDET